MRMGLDKLPTLGSLLRLPGLSLSHIQRIGAGMRMAEYTDTQRIRAGMRMTECTDKQIRRDKYAQGSGICICICICIAFAVAFALSLAFGFRL